MQGYTPIAQGFWPFLRNLILPAVALGADLHRADRAHHPRHMLEVLQQDYIRTARAKGVGQRGMLFVHALKNAAVPIVTVIGIGIALLIGGAVVTESVFAIPGLGRLTVDAILRRDYPVIQGVVLLFSFVYVLVNLVVDLLYTAVRSEDPLLSVDHQHSSLPPASPSRRSCRTCCRRSSAARPSSASSARHPTIAIGGAAARRR